MFSLCYWTVALLFELFIHLPSQFIQKQNFNRSTCAHRELLDLKRAQDATPLLTVLQPLPGKQAKAMSLYEPHYLRFALISILNSAECSRTNSQSALTFSTGVSGRMPWPRLKMWPGRPAAWRKMSSARFLSSFQSAKSSTGSRLPCTAFFKARVCHPVSNGMRQSK